jgi:cytochrome c peroxidase
MKSLLLSCAGVLCLALAVSAQNQGAGSAPGLNLDGMRSFETDTFGGNGRTCRTCHSLETGTVSPADAQQRFAHDPNDPLFLHDGSDDGYGHGATRMLTDATVLITIPLAPNVSLEDDPGATTVVLRRGIPTTLNSPALDSEIMLDGRQTSLESQAAGAIADHARGAVQPFAVLHSIAEFQTTNAFFTSPEVRRFALGTGPAPVLPEGRTASEKRGRRFFEDVGPNPADGFTSGLCSHCHSGPMLNQTNQFAADFILLPIPAGQRFISVGVSEFNAAANPVRAFVFDRGTPNEVRLLSSDPGRSLITGLVNDFTTGIVNDPLLANTNAFKIAPLRGIARTAPYFHDNSAKTLEDVAAHYALFFNIVTVGTINLTQEDQQDIVAFLKLLK